MTINVVTSPTHLSSSNNHNNNNNNETTASNLNNNYHSNMNCNNFLRGGFKSSSINYGSPIRRQQRNEQHNINGHYRPVHHHPRHVHHPHCHSASPTIHSDSSLTPVEDLELSDGAIAYDNRLANSDNVTVNSNTTNSIWYEYGCV